MYELPLVEDIEWLDERRAAVGLGPWLHYERQMAEQQGREPARAPRSFQSEDENAIHDEAMQVLKRVSRHYGTLPVMTDLIATSFVMEGRKDETSSIQVRLNGESSEAVGIVPPTALDIYLIDGTLFLGLVGAPGMVVAEVDGDPLASAEQHLGIAFAYLPPQLWMRWTDGTERAGEWFTFGMLDESKIKGVSSREIEGRRVYEITFEGIAPLLGGRSGKGVARIDAESLLLAEVVIDGGTDEEVPTFRFEAAFSPLTPVVLETPIEVELSEDAPRYNGFMDMLTTALAAKPTLEVGTIAPPFQLRDQHGNEHSLEDYRGQYVVLDWWGLWCAPCVESLPHIQELHDKYADDDSVSVLLMNVRDDVEKTRAYLREHEYTFTSLDDADGMVEAYGIRAFPSVVLLGPDGIVLHAEAGSSAEVERVLERALAEHKAAVSGP